MGFTNLKWTKTADFLAKDSAAREILLLKRLTLASHKADLPKSDALEKKNGQNLGFPDLSLTLNIIPHSLVFLNFIFITILASWSPECGLFHPNTGPKQQIPH